MTWWPIAKSLFTLHPGYSLRALNNKYKLTVLVVRQWPGLRAYLARLSNALGAGGLRRLGEDCVGVVQWPYISRLWEAPVRFDVLASHYEEVARHHRQLLLLGRDERLVLFDLAAYSAACTLVLDRPFWFMREGELVLNLFQGELRVASLAFTLCRREGELCIFIGAVQGIHKGVDSERSLEIYRVLTKDFEGLRPRSLLIEVLKCLARHVGATRLYAVGDGYRHHRHPYFGAEKARELPTDYDAIWREHGATPSEREDFFAMPLAASRKPVEEIPSKKRAMYRRRHELLEQIFARVEAALPVNARAATEPWQGTVQAAGPTP